MKKEKKTQKKDNRNQIEENITEIEHYMVLLVSNCFRYTHKIHIYIISEIDY